MTSSDSFYPRIIALFRDPAVRASLITFAATSAAFAVALRLRERGRIRRFKEQVAREFESGDVHTFETSFSHAPDPFSRGIREVRPIDESLVREQLARHYSFFGDEAMQKIRGAFVIVVGLGGVGSHAAHMLARAGCGRLRIIDFDQVTLSSLNRHAVATQADVGTPKAVCLKNHLARICPFVKVEIAVELFNLEAAPRLLGGSPDFVLDCIDNIDTKLDLITYCHENKIPVIASMGSGAKHDPSRIQIADISQTQEDPLARTVRRKLKLTRNIEHGIPVVYSTEKPGPVKLLPLSDEMYEQLQAPGARPDDYAVLPEFRSRILPVLGTLPAMFGCAMASYVALRLADWPEEEFEPLPSKKRVRMYDRLYRDLRTRDQNVYQAE